MHRMHPGVDAVIIGRYGLVQSYTWGTALTDHKCRHITRLRKGVGPPLPRCQLAGHRPANVHVTVLSRRLAIEMLATCKLIQL